MFSLSHVIFLRNWITAGCSLFLWFGLSLVTIAATTNRAEASPVASSGLPDRAAASEPETQATETQAAETQATETQKEAAEAEIENFAVWQDATVIDLALVEPASESDAAVQAKSQSAAETNTQAESELSDPEGDRPASPIAFATLLPDAPTAETADSSTPAADTPATQVAQQPVTIPTFANTDECFADCNPSERFQFRQPAELSLSPLAPSRAASVAQAPYPGSSAPGTTTPAPGSEPAAAPTGQPAPTAASDFDSPLPSTALTPPSLHLQGVYIYQGDESSARARITGVYPLTPRIQVGGSIDITDGDVFSEGGDDGVSINELYVTLAPQDLPNLRFVLGQLDLTSYFDRNSFAKDAATQFFNPVFSTNPALAAAGIGSRQGALVNWTVTDNIEARAVIFSSDRSISEFELNAFAGELGVRLGNLIVRGTYVTSEDSGSGDGFQEIFNIDRGNGQFGAREGDRENAYGINAEYFIPEISLGLFGRYGHYENADLDEGGDAFNFGVNVYDLFMESDRLGVGYGQALSNADLRRDNNDEIPDVLEVFYDFRLLPGIRVGVSYQSLNEFSESIAGFRVRGDFNLTPRQP